MLSVETYAATPWPDAIDWEARASEAVAAALALTPYASLADAAAVVVSGVGGVMDGAPAGRDAQASSSEETSDETRRGSRGVMATAESCAAMAFDVTRTRRPAVTRLRR